MKRIAPFLVLLAACGSSKGTSSDPGTKVAPAISSARQAELAEVQSKLAEVKDLDATGFAAKYAVPFSTGLGYEPLKAEGYSLIKASPLAPNPGEEARLAANGFVITDRLRAPSFIYGYENVYSADLPVYVSADSILYAVHRSFDQILKSVEQTALLPALQQLVDGMRGALQGGAANDLSIDARRDLDVYLAVAASLLSGTSVAPVAGGDAATVKSLVDKAIAASGSDRITLFGTGRDVDFSQFTPRGHYTDSLELTRYFRATMWFGRTDLRLVETLPDGSQVFRRRQLEGAYAMRATMTGDTLSAWKTLDDVIGGFVGEHDNMTVAQLDSLLADLHLARAADLAGLSDAAIAQAIVAGAYGRQRIASDLLENGTGKTLPLSSTFLLLGQRYTVDSHVFANVVWDRVAHGTAPHRLMPNPLDVAFGALGNNQAGQLLGTELQTYAYAPDLASMRVLVDAHPAEYWDSSLYTEWLGMQRALSPTADVANPNAVGMPKVTGTEPWGRRILSTQLASWAELRHDTVLYAKQSYTGGNSCVYPDAYVEPYPELFARLGAFAAKGAALTSGLPAPQYGPSYGAYFEQLRTVAATLESMAKNQRTGAPHTTEQMAFINQLTFSNGCGSLASFDGWYAKLFFSPQDAIETDPTIADVHTQPYDDAGNEVGNVLHVGTTAPRLMLVTVESCSGARAYAGYASSYHEKITGQYVRLTDEDWSKDLWTNPPPEVPWFSDLVLH